MAARNLYRLLFHGEKIAAFSSVHANQVVHMGYRKLDIPRGHLSMVPEIIVRAPDKVALMEALANEENDDQIDLDRFRNFFLITLTPGSTEISLLSECRATDPTV